MSVISRTRYQLRGLGPQQKELTPYHSRIAHAISSTRGHCCPATVESPAVSLGKGGCCLSSSPPVIPFAGSTSDFGRLCLDIPFVVGKECGFPSDGISMTRLSDRAGLVASSSSSLTASISPIQLGGPFLLCSSASRTAFSYAVVREPSSLVSPGRT